MAQDSLKQRLANCTPLIGTFVKTPSYIITEVLGKTRLDAVCLDAEHAPFGRMELDQCIHALINQGMPALVRVQSSAPEQILNALDCGATGVVIPHVCTAAQAIAAAKAAHFGAGGRGYAGSTRAAGYGTKSMPNHLADSARETVVVAQIEDLEALEEIEAIAQVEAIDCLFVGRIDLTVALGAESPKAPKVVEAVERICQAGIAAGRPVGMFVSDLDEIPDWISKGASFFLLSSDHALILSGADTLLNRFELALTKAEQKA